LIKYTSSLNTRTVSWSTIDMTSTIGGSQYQLSNLIYTGAAWFVFTSASNFTAATQTAAVWYNTSANPSTGTWTRVPYMSLPQQLQPYSGGQPMYRGIGWRKD
jgi:hypothetical protein